MLLALAFSLSTFAHPPVHLDLEMESHEYAKILEKMEKNKEGELDNAPVNRAISMGTRLSAWLAFENNRRSESEALRLSNPTTRRGIPVDKPSVYSDKTVEAELKKLEVDMPAQMLAVLSGAAFPSTLPLPDEAFIVLARRVDRNYQSAARYKSLLPWMSHYRQAKNKDVRGYYYMRSKNYTAADMSRFETFAEDEKQRIRDALYGMCLNISNVNPARCKSALEQDEKEGKLAQSFATYSARSVQVWNAFFDIPDFAVRSDVTHTDPNLMIVPFNTPKVAKFIPYLQGNVEDEFKFQDWKMVIKFGTFPNGARLTFKPGVTPHVTGLGGNEIVMDSNQPIEEYESQWTIRHEFGHVIGLPDCYHEFYDDDQKAFVNYQLDITDLMCSRAGDMNERIYKELKRAYHN